MRKSVAKMNALSRGVMIFAILAVLTVVEYFLGILDNTGVYVLLWLIAFLKGGLVLWFFMHLPRVFNPSEGDGGHE